MRSYLEQALVKIEEFEGTIPWMYVDAIGRVTVGVGTMLPDAAAAKHLPFQVGARAATEEEIEADFARVDALPMGRAARFYWRDGGPELEAPVIKALLRTVLVGFEGELREKLAGYEGFPDEVKMALLDMTYNLGPAGLLNGYPGLIRAVEAGAWTRAAAASFRHGPGAARNQWTSTMLRRSIVGGIKAEADGTLKRLGFGIVGIGAALVERVMGKR